jgi:hypothetical protein
MSTPKGTVYKLYFVIPADTYDTFGKTKQRITAGQNNGAVRKSKEADDVSARISQWVLKME